MASPPEGNISFTEYASADLSVKKIIANWFSGSGSSNGIAQSVTTNVFDGHVIGAAYVTSNAPTNAYNVQVFDKDGTDVLMGQGLTRTNTVGVYQFTAESSLAAVSHSNLNFYITAANVNRNGTVVLYIR